MAQMVPTNVNDLKLDLTNFRTVPQPSEAAAVHAMISISPDWFWALMESLIDDGYLPTENILVLESPGVGRNLVVKEGNRRIAVLKILHGYLTTDIDPPEHIAKKIKALSSSWKTANQLVPCTIYEAKDAALVDRIVTRTHGKGEKAGRDQWESIARARHNRDLNNASEPGLDLLEKYLKEGKNLTVQQKERWAGDYYLSVLEEAIKKLSPLCGAANARDLANKYPNVQNLDPLEDVMRDIGLEILNFTKMRQSNHDFGSYGFSSAATTPATPSLSGSSTGTTGGTGPATGTTPTGGPGSAPPGSGRGVPLGAATGATGSGASSGTSPGVAGSSTGTATAPSQPRAVAAVPLQDPRAVTRLLKKFVPRGQNREKVVTLRDEAKKLKLADNPIAFCFLLRSMFEISAKAYCKDHEREQNAPRATKQDGTDRWLIDVLKDVNAHLIGTPPDRTMQRVLHGAITELAKPEGILSVTSMNQLVHNPRYSIQVADICCLFVNIFPLLEAMN